MFLGVWSWSRDRARRGIGRVGVADPGIGRDEGSGELESRIQASCVWGIKRVGVTNLGAKAPGIGRVRVTDLGAAEAFGCLEPLSLVELGRGQLSFMRDPVRGFSQPEGLS
jgi:hypothetical protein